MLVVSEGGEAEELVDEENGILISTMLRQYFMGLRTVGQWKTLSAHWVGVAEEADVPKSPSSPRANRAAEAAALPAHAHKEVESSSESWREFLLRRLGLRKKPRADDEDDHFDPHRDTTSSSGNSNGEESDSTDDKMDFQILLMRKFWARWAARAGVKSCVCDSAQGDCTVDWTRVIAPCVEGRIRMVGGDEAQSQ